MNNNTFFKPTPLYKEFVILDLVEKEEKITQRMMSDYLSVSVSMINNYLDNYEKSGYIKRIYVNSKNVKYNISKSGIERKKVLNIQYLKASSLIYNGAKNNLTTFLQEIIKKGFSKIILYGAGEVAEILLQTIRNDNSIPLDVVAVVDDNIEKMNRYLVNTEIISSNKLSEYKHDCILVSSYKHNNEIYKKLIALNYNKSNIIQFFK